MTTDAITGISESGYSATADQIRELGALSVGATRLKDAIGTTYIRALVRTAQDTLSVSSKTWSEALSYAHTSMYPDVLVGVTTDDVKPLLPLPQYRPENKRRSLERNSRSNFARTAASAVRKFINRGGDLEGLEVANLTKASVIASTTNLTDANPMDDIGPQTSPTHAVCGNLERAWTRFVRALDKDDDRASRAQYYSNELSARYSNV